MCAVVILQVELPRRCLRPSVISDEQDWNKENFKPKDAGWGCLLLLSLQFYVFTFQASALYGTFQAKYKLSEGIFKTSPQAEYHELTKSVLN